MAIAAAVSGYVVPTILRVPITRAAWARSDIAGPANALERTHP